MFFQGGQRDFGQLAGRDRQPHQLAVKDLQTMVRLDSGIKVGRPGSRASSDASWLCGSGDALTSLSLCLLVLTFQGCGEDDADNTRSCALGSRPFCIKERDSCFLSESLCHTLHPSSRREWVYSQPHPWSSHPLHIYDFFTLSRPLLMFPLT